MVIMGLAIRLKFHEAHLTPSKLHSLVQATLPVQKESWEAAVHSHRLFVSEEPPKTSLNLHHHPTDKNTQAH